MIASARGLYRLGVTLVGFVAAAVIASLAVALPALRWELPSAGQLATACERLLPGAPELQGLAVLMLAILGGAVVVKGTVSLVRQLLAHRRLMGSLPVRDVRELDDAEVVVVDDRVPQAFCAGYLRPRVHLSTGALDTLDEAQRRTVLAHERFHCSRRDPLRLLLAHIVSDALFFVPGVRHARGRYASLSELAADEAAIRETHDGPSLAAALLASGEQSATAGAVGIAPERVDHLMGERPAWQLSHTTLAASAAVLAALAASAIVAGTAGAASVNPALALANGCAA